jgi:CRP-like cAMP-binding protein
VARKLSLHSPLSLDVQQALDETLGRPQPFVAGAVIAESGDAADLTTVVRQGFICRATILAPGRRQIHALLLPGDSADLEATVLAKRSDRIEALTNCSVWLVPKARLAAAAAAHPQLSEALLRETVINAEIARQWVVNVGGRSAYERIAHLLCELCARMDAAGMGDAGLYPFPFTQQIIGDAQGLSMVHVNRVFQQLKANKLIDVRARRLRILDASGLSKAALFDPRYLHYREAKAA